MTVMGFSGLQDPISQGVVFAFDHKTIEMCILGLRQSDNTT